MHSKRDSASINSKASDGRSSRQILRLPWTSSNGPRDRNLQTLSLSHILPPNVFQSNISVHVPHGLNDRTASSPNNHLQKWSMKMDTEIVLPGHHQRFTRKKFFDHYDFEGIKDKLGQGEFGDVYKCRKVIIEEIGDDESCTDTEDSNVDPESNNDNNDRYGEYTDCESDSDDDDIENKEIFAVKRIRKAKFYHLNDTHKAESIKSLQQEIKLLEKMQHLKAVKVEGSKYVNDVIDVFEDRNYLYIVTKFCDGNNLWTHIENAADNEWINDRKDNIINGFIRSCLNGDVEIPWDLMAMMMRYYGADWTQIESEIAIQNIMRQILEGLAFLHRNNIAHLDIKPENIIFDKEGNIQLIDLGMSRMIPSLHKAGVIANEPYFAAPEVIEGFHDKKADIWSAGVLFFMLRFGYLPFFDGINDVNDTNTYYKLSSQIKQGFESRIKEGFGPWFPSRIAISVALEDLISKMLERDLAKRLTALECLAHPYFATTADNTEFAPTIMNTLTRFSAQYQFKILTLRLFGNYVEPDKMKVLEQLWNKFDIDKDGSLTLAQFGSVMMEYENGYKDYQIEAMFEALDWNETQTINFNSLLCAFSCQRLLAFDERLWEAFARLDVDNDGYITKGEIKRVLAMVNPNYFNEGIERLEYFQQPRGQDTSSPEERKRRRNASIFIGDCMIESDWDDDHQIHYEEFLRELHPRFSEDPVTPKALAKQPEFIFPPSMGMGMQLGHR